MPGREQRDSHSPSQLVVKCVVSHHTVRLQLTQHQAYSDTLLGMGAEKKTLLYFEEVTNPSTDAALPRENLANIICLAGYVLV